MGGNEKLLMNSSSNNNSSSAHTNNDGALLTTTTTSNDNNNNNNNNQDEEYRPLNGGTSTTTNGGSNHGGGNTSFLPMEMEEFVSSTSSTTLRMPIRVGMSRTRHIHDDHLYQLHMRSGYWGKFCFMMKLYMELYPITCSIILFTTIGGLFIMVVELFPHYHRYNKHYERNHLQQDYSDIQMDYTFKASQIDHWCLYGGDDKCTCDDFTEPTSRASNHGWVRAHERNLHRVQTAMKERMDIDVIFIGDDFIEMFNGRYLDRYIPTIGPSIQSLYNSTFTKQGGGQFNSLALGIYGDSTSNVLWRIQHGEMPTTTSPSSGQQQLLTSKVWWLWIGINDLSRGGCSEQAVTLGILRTAEEMAARHPKSVIVVMGILPRSNHGGILYEEDDQYDHSSSDRFHLFRNSGSDRASSSSDSFGATTATTSRRHRGFRPTLPPLWPSIQVINKEIEEFCMKHEHLVYFDASKLFIGTMSNEHYQSTEKRIIQGLMEDYAHPTIDGYKILMKKIEEELERILYDRDEHNDIEIPTTTSTTTTTIGDGGRGRGVVIRNVSEKDISKHHQAEEEEEESPSLPLVVVSSESSR